jgi:hypothetical protein
MGIRPYIDDDLAAAGWRALCTDGAEGGMRQTEQRFAFRRWIRRAAADRPIAMLADSSKS